jgi:hypothetical protein
LFEALERRGVRYLVIGMSAAVLEGAPIATQYIDLWFERRDDERVKDAAKEAGGFWISGFGMQPPSFGGDGLDRIDVVLTAHGLDSFDTEYARRVAREVDGVNLPVLPLERVVASKRVTRRPKDLGAAAGVGGHARSQGWWRSRCRASVIYDDLAMTSGLRPPT